MQLLLYQHIIDTPTNLIKNSLGLQVNNNPEIYINDDLTKLAVSKFKMNTSNLNILLGIGGSGPTKRIPSKTFLSVIEKISGIKKCKFFLATGKNDDEQKMYVGVR